MRINRYLIIAVLLIICGIALVGLSIASGEGSAGVVLFIPVFYGTGILAFLGVLCIMAALFLGFLGIATQMGATEEYEAPQEQRPYSGTRPRTEKKIKGGGVVLIGPIPVIFGSDAKTAMVLVVLALILIIAVAILFYI